MRRNPTLFFLTIFFLLSCTVSEENQIIKTLNQREEALRKKDLSLYLSCVSKAYQDKDEDFGRLQNRIEDYFKTFDRIEYTCWDRTIHIEGERAVVIQQFNLEVEKGGKKNRYSGREALLFKKEGRGWRILKGLSN
jgi:ketosteroid isomerase-like protein